VELGDASTKPLSRQKEVLKKLWGYQDDELNSISDVDQVHSEPIVRCQSNDQSLMALHHILSMWIFMFLDV